VYRRADPGPVAAGAAHDDVLTVDEVASLLRVTPAWVYSQTQRDRIPHMRLGRYLRYRRSAIEAWLGALEGEHAPDRPAN
jgi:excisionase family DNA binding protein